MSASVPPHRAEAAPLAGSPARRVAARAAVAAWAAACVLLLFSGAMLRDVGFDEDPYVVAGAMSQIMMPYRDFAVLGTPLAPLVLGVVFRFADGWFLLASRLFGFGLAAVSGGLLWLLVRRLGAGLGLAAVLLTACLASPFLQGPLAGAGEDGLALVALLAGLAAHLFAESRRYPGRSARWEAAARFGAALLLGLAAEAKATYLFGPLGLLVHALFAPRWRLAPVLCGLAVAAVPAAWCGWVAPEGVRFGLLDYPLTAKADGWPGQDAPLAPWAQALGAGVTGGSLAVLALACGLSVVAMARRRKWKRPGRLLLGLTVAALACALVPGRDGAPSFAPVVPLLACCVAHLDRITTHLAGRRNRRLLIGVAALAMVPTLAAQVAALPGLLDRGAWAGVAVHREARAIRDLVPAGEAGGEVATLFPLLVIDANPVRREFATGPFVFRSGEAFAPGRLARVHALSPAMLEAAFARSPPDAILAGRYAEAAAVPMDTALAAYAERHGWPLVRTDEKGGRLWIAPRGGAGQIPGQAPGRTR